MTIPRTKVSVSIMDRAVRYKSVFLASGRIDALFKIFANKNNNGKNEFPPKISLTKILYFFVFINANPPDISGNAVTKERIVAPNTTPET